MPTSRALESVRAALVRRGVPRAYVDRLLDELSAHRDDLTADLLAGGLTRDAAEAEADRRMGDPAAVAAAACSILRCSTWTGRHPALALILLPAAALLFGWAGLLLLT